MYKRFVGALYVLNIIFQAFFTLLTPVGLGVLVSWLLTKYAGLGQWIYAPIIIFGVFAGLISMIKFTISASEGLERLEKEQRKKYKDTKKTPEEKNKNEKRV